MKRDFLKDLGIEDKEIINKILDENSADIGRAKGETDELTSQITTLQSQLDKKTSEYDTLKESTKDYGSLTEKIKTLELEIAQLTTDKAQLTLDLDTKVTEIKMEYAIEDTVRSYKAKNVKAVVALLDRSKITYDNGELGGVTDQLDALVKGEDTSFLFGGSSTAPSGTHLSNPPTGGNGNVPTSANFAEAVAKALAK